MLDLIVMRTSSFPYMSLCLILPTDLLISFLISHWRLNHWEQESNSECLKVIIPCFWHLLLLSKSLSNINTIFTLIILKDLFCFTSCFIPKTVFIKLVWTQLWLLNQVLWLMLILLNSMFDLRWDDVISNLYP